VCLVKPISKPSHQAFNSRWMPPAKAESIITFNVDVDILVEGSLRHVARWDKIDQGDLLLSGGQHQRLFIDQTIAVKVGIILIDEPESAIDSDNY
jgi:ABC-type phosphate transport system ATPase subunit